MDGTGGGWMSTYLWAVAGWMGKWMDKRVDGQASGWTSQRMDERADGQASGWTSEWMDEPVDG